MIPAAFEYHVPATAAEAVAMLARYGETIIQRLPRMTAILNRAKRETAAVLQDILDNLAEGRRVVTETLRTLDALLGDRESA